MCAVSAQSEGSPAKLHIINRIRLWEAVVTRDHLSGNYIFYFDKGKLLFTFII